MLLQGKSIYLVEDNENNIYVLSLLLRHQGARLTIDWWAKGELNRLAEAMPLDLIILDLMLPAGRNGYDVFDEIRSHSQFDEVPIVVVSAADPKEEVPKARDKGLAGFISKPVDDELFPRQVKDLIEGKQVWYTG